MFSLMENEYTATARDAQSSHIQAIKRHPRCTICLAQVPTRGEWLRTVEDADIIKPKKSSFEYIVSTGVLAVNPPQKVAIRGNERMERWTHLPRKIEQ